MQNNYVLEAKNKIWHRKMMDVNSLNKLEEGFSSSREQNSGRAFQQYKRGEANLVKFAKDFIEILLI